MIKKISIFLLLLLATVLLPAQSRFALVIGNNAYAELGSLKNPVNDATDIAATLGNLGFKVELLKNTNLGSMEKAVINLKNKLSVDKDSIGFFYYAGHGVQSNGQNFLIPANAYIADEAFLKTKSLSIQVVMDLLQSAGNSLNMIILDACRDNPFSWSRGGNRGLSVLGTQPPGSIIVYATSAGNVARDGTGRNGLFTTELLKHLKIPGLDVAEVFRRTGAGVRDASSGSQIPAVYNQFFDRIYLAGTGSSAARTPGFQEEAAKYGSVKISVIESGTVYIDGTRMGSISANRSATMTDITTGVHDIEVRYNDNTERKSVTVTESKTVQVAFSYRRIVETPKVDDNLVLIRGSTFWMGSTGGDSDEKPVHSVTVSSFYISPYEVTQKEYRSVMGSNPSDTGKGIGDNYPVNKVSWNEAVEYCNRLSRKEGLTPCYSGSGNSIRCNFNANGYRLPTEAEWEYAARGGQSSQGYTYAGGNSVGSVAWYKDNSGKKTHPVGQKQANELGLYDMSGNVWEWCWDWKGSYSSGSRTDPTGPSSGSRRVRRGGGWDRDGRHCRSANRHDSPWRRASYLGFRVVRRP